MVQGINKLKQKLAKHGVTLEQAVGEAMVEGAARVVQAARLLCPSDSGELRNTIRHSQPKLNKRGNLMVVIAAGDESTRVGTAHQFQLARIKEFGTTQQPAQPFLMPAWRLNRSALKADVRKAMRTVIRATNSGR